MEKDRDNRSMRIGICSQKGGVGKSTYTILFANILHFMRGYRIVVIDADYPQWSIDLLRKRELDQVRKSEYWKQRTIDQYHNTGRDFWKIVATKPSKADIAITDVCAGHSPGDVVMIDLPGTIGSEGIISAIAELDYLFIPIKADKLIMESSLSFANALQQLLLNRSGSRLKGINLFWTMIDKRERTPLYDQYDKVIAELGLNRLDTHIPQRSKFNKENDWEGGKVFRSTLFPPDRAYIRECLLEPVCDEIISLTGM